MPPSSSKSHWYFVIEPSGSDEALASNVTFWPLALAVNLAIGSWLVVTLTTPDIPSTCPVCGLRLPWIEQ